MSKNSIEIKSGSELLTLSVDTWGVQGRLIGLTPCRRKYADWDSNPGPIGHFSSKIKDSDRAQHPQTSSNTLKVGSFVGSGRKWTKNIHPP